MKLLIIICSALIGTIGMLLIVNSGWSPLFLVCSAYLFGSAVCIAQRAVEDFYSA